MKLNETLLNGNGDSSFLLLITWGGETARLHPAIAMQKMDTFCLWHSWINLLGFRLSELVSRTRKNKEECQGSCDCHWQSSIFLIKLWWLLSSRLRISKVSYGTLYAEQHVPVVNLRCLWCIAHNRISKCLFYLYSSLPAWRVFCTVTLSPSNLANP